MISFIRSFTAEERSVRTLVVVANNPSSSGVSLMPLPLRIDRDIRLCKSIRSATLQLLRLSVSQNTHDGQQDWTASRSRASTRGGQGRPACNRIGKRQGLMAPATVSLGCGFPTLSGQRSESLSQAADGAIAEIHPPIDPSQFHERW